MPKRLAISLNVISKPITSARRFTAQRHTYLAVRNSGSIPHRQTDGAQISYLSSMATERYKQHAVIQHLVASEVGHAQQWMAVAACRIVHKAGYGTIVCAALRKHRALFSVHGIAELNSVQL